jgi:hypothetical protein
MILANLPNISTYDTHLVRLEAGVRKCEGRGKVREQPTEAMEFFQLNRYGSEDMECVVKMKEERNKRKEGRKRMKVVSRGKKMSKDSLSHR